MFSRLARIAIVWAIIAALFVSPLAATAQVLPPATAAAPSGSEVGVIYQLHRAFSVGAAWWRSFLGVSRTRSLESFAVALGVQLGSPNDQAVFDAANAAIIAAKASGGLTVMLPMDKIENATHLLVDNNGGYACPAPGRCRVHDAYAGPYTSPTYLVELNDPFATNIVLSGINFDGGWTYGAGAYSANPESDPALDMRGGVNLVSAFNGPYNPAAGTNDAQYVANSDSASQEPRKYIQNLFIARFPGDCFTEVGAGSNNTDNVRTQRCGGYSANINTYDSNFSDLDLGESGRSGMLCHDNCAANRFSPIKIWYPGFRNLAPSTPGLDIEGGTGNQFIGLEVQDSGGDCIKIDNGDLNRILGSCQWQGQINQLQPVTCALDLYGAIDNHFELIVSLLNHAGQTYYRANKLICDSRSLRDHANVSYAYHNTAEIVTENWPQDFNPLSPSWINGPFSTANSLSINGVLRQPYAYAVDPATGQGNFGVNMCGTLAGMVAWGPTGAYPGSLSFVAACGGTMSFQGETTTGAYASATLTSTANYDDGETIQVGAVVYTMKATLTGAPNEIHIGATEAATVANISAAIDAANAAVVVGQVSGNTLTVPQVLSGALHPGDVVTCLDPINCTAWVTTTITAQATIAPGLPAGGQGTYTLANSEPTIAYTNAINVVTGVIGADYGYGSTPSFQVSASNNGAHVVTVKSLAMGVAGNAIPVATTAAHAAWSGSTLASGAADVQSYNAGLTIDQFGNFVSPKLQLQGHFTSDAAYCASPHAVNGGFYTDTSSGRAVVYQASC